jgi:hypothetical protein
MKIFSTSLMGVLYETIHHSRPKTSCFQGIYIYIYIWNDLFLVFAKWQLKFRAWFYSSKTESLAGVFNTQVMVCN